MAYIEVHLMEVIIEILHILSDVNWVVLELTLFRVKVWLFERWVKMFGD
jgi:hypothetical protein